MSPEWKGTRVGHQPLFPLLVKFIFADEKLSVQVHPDNAYAARHEQAAGGCGKTEMWYTLRAAPDAVVLAGLKPGVTRASFERAVAEGSTEELINRIPLRAGDAVFIPAGTVHTIGAGLVLCEIQQNSDLTYRVHDYNRRDKHGRPRELHIEKALEVIRLGAQHGGKLEFGPPLRNGAAEQALLVACEHFATERWNFAAPIAPKSHREHFDLLIFLEGQGTIAWGDQRVAYAPAQVWLIPAALGEYHLAPAAPTSLLRTHAPARG
jgi:mannose-6-phosphate isomerase